MNSRERVLKTINHEPVDRVPLNLWNFREDVQQMVVEKHGSQDAFHEKLGIDLFMSITPPPNVLNQDFLEQKMTMKADEIRPEHIMDPDDPKIYEWTSDLLEKYKGEKAVAAHVWGVAESLYSFIGIEETMFLMAAEPELTKDLFVQFADFSRRVSENLCCMGIDILHITGDVGSNGAMLFSPEMWREQVKDFDAGIAKVGKDAGLPVSLHSCGYFMPVIEDFIEMGVDLIHPVQESAGMSLQEVKEKYGDQLAINGGLDVRLLPRLTEDGAEAEVRRVMDICKPGFGFIFNTAHTVQPDTSLDVLERAYLTAQDCGLY